MKRYNPAGNHGEALDLGGLFMRRMSAFFVAAITAVWAGDALARPQAPAAQAWQAMTRADLEAAHALIQDHHPGAVPVLGDEAFLGRLTDGFQTALARIPAVTDFAGYRAVLSGFATGFGDEHVTSNPRVGGIDYRWAGVVMTRQGGAWVVASQSIDDDALLGARLVSCDGEPADSLAAARLAFRVSAPIEAQLIANAGFMFVDDGNPFLSEPRTCLFEATSGPITVAMDWTPVATSRLAEALNAASGGAQAGFGTGSREGRWWIAMERLSDQAASVIDSLETSTEAWSESPAIIIDLRGNGGGDSRHGRRLADLIYGPERTASVLRDATACAALWRASADNAAHVRAFAARAQDPQTSQYYAGLADEIDRAIAAGQPFDAALPVCPSDPIEAVEIPASRYDGKVVVITDHACFSSCLLMVRDFRALGALHVGEATNAATRYMEVREVALPSGLSTFSTMQKVVIGENADIGPFVPAHVFPGRMSDTPALEAWVAGLTSGS